MDTLSGAENLSKLLSPFWKGIFSKRKEFAPNGSKFFPFRVDPFSEENWCIESKEEVKKRLLSLYKLQKMYQVPIKS